jgi:hypothetical protein
MRVALFRVFGAFLLLTVAVVGAGCGGSDDETAADTTAAETTSPRPSSTTATQDLREQISSELGTLHRSTIAEVPGLRALFYHHPDGWAVEDTSLDNGATWCRHAWYTWNVTDAVAPDDFTVTYTPTFENPDCVPLGQPLTLHVLSREVNDDGAVVLTGEYQPGGLHVERTICSGTIDDYEDVCGLGSELGEPTPEPPPT